MTHRPVAIVTGGSRRVGRAIALAFARHGFHVIITARSITQDTRDTADAIRHAGGTAAAEILDLNDPAAVNAFGNALGRSLARLDVLVHNASIYAPSPLATLTPDDALCHYRINALAPLILTRALAPLMAASPLQARPSVIAMADMHALGRPRKDFAPYAMSKAALIEMVRSLARDLAPAIRVNAIAPGVVAFPDSGYESDPDMQAAYLKRVPLQRSGTPDDAAALAAFLALDAPYITGEIIRLDGGRWLA